MFSPFVKKAEIVLLYLRSFLLWLWIDFYAVAFVGLCAYFLRWRSLVIFAMVFNNINTLILFLPLHWTLIYIFIIAFIVYNFDFSTREELCIFSQWRLLFTNCDILLSPQVKIAGYFDDALFTFFFRKGRVSLPFPLKKISGFFDSDLLATTLHIGNEECRGKFSRRRLLVTVLTLLLLQIAWYFCYRRGVKFWDHHTDYSLNYYLSTLVPQSFSLI